MVGGGRSWRLNRSTQQAPCINGNVSIAFFVANQEGKVASCPQKLQVTVIQWRWYLKCIEKDTYTEPQHTLLNTSFMSKDTQVKARWTTVHLLLMPEVWALQHNPYLIGMTLHDLEKWPMQSSPLLGRIGVLPYSYLTSDATICPVSVSPQMIRSHDSMYFSYHFLWLTAVVFNFYYCLSLHQYYKLQYGRYCVYLGHQYIQIP